jgi:hydroxymethylpyrimidine kinase/phosphomethylpyrimidine kinase/thiamine-phosphate diphosphorylase
MRLTMSRGYLVTLFLIYWVIPSLSLSALGRTTNPVNSATKSVFANDKQVQEPLQAPAPAPPPIVYTIAGSDSGGGAGIQADLHCIRSFGCHGCSAITCLTAQNSVGVTGVHAPPASFLQQQLDVLVEDLPPAAIKIGMLGTKELAVTVGSFLQKLKAANKQQHDDGADGAATGAAPPPARKIWVVMDPVMISTSGHRLIDDEASQAMIDHVFPAVDVLTPNLYEAEALLGRKLVTVQDVEQGARDLIAMGVPAVLVKGGHTFSDDRSESSNADDTASSASSASATSSSSSSASYAQDYFLSSEDASDEPRLCDGNRGVWLRSPRYDTEHTHGTGCTLSSAIASALALGEQQRRALQDTTINQQGAGAGAGTTSAIYPIDACCLAKAYVTAGIYTGVQLGQGPGPVGQTEFPSQFQHYPTVAMNPDKDPPAFRRMKAFSDRHGQYSDDNRPVLGRILPIFNTVDWVERLCLVSSAPAGVGGDGAAAAAVTDIQLRIKDETDPAKILEIVQRSQTACAAAGIRLWINDYWQAAVEAGCFGVHVGQEDLVKCIDKGGLEAMQAANMALGISTHSYGELSAALGVKPSYISLGPVFATSSKNVGFDPQGLSTVRKWRQLISPDVPLVAIGGIGDTDTATRVKEAGADCAAVIGAVTKAKETRVAVSQLNEAMI